MTLIILFICFLLQSWHVLTFPEAGGSGRFRSCMECCEPLHEGLVQDLLNQTFSLSLACWAIFPRISCKAEEHHVQRAVEHLGLCLTVVPSVSSVASPRKSDASRSWASRPKKPVRICSLKALETWLELQGYPLRGLHCSGAWEVGNF